MIKVKNSYLDNCSKFIFITLIWILVFQSPLEKVWDPFSYIDEIVALIGAILGVYDIVIVRKCRPSKEQMIVGVLITAFVVTGLAGNLIYQYQPIKSVIIDLYTNLKFFFAVGTGYYLFKNAEWKDLENVATVNARLIVFFIFILFLVDRVLNIWPAEIRYGIKSVILFYHHMTYLAGAMAFIVVLLTIFYQKKNLPYIAMALVIIAFTLRSKAIVAVLAYIAMFVFFVVLKQKLKLWYLAVLGIAGIAIAWPKISFYFIELAGHSARSVFLITSLLIMKEYFQIGTGFGTFGSAEAAKNYSPVYYKYNFHLNYELRNVNDLETALELIENNEWLSAQYANNPNFLYGQNFMSDHFWPIIFGQTGAIGTVIFLVILCNFVYKCLKLYEYNLYSYVGVMFVFVYILISSIAEPAFHNAVAIPLAIAVGIVFYKSESNIS